MNNNICSIKLDLRSSEGYPVPALRWSGDIDIAVRYFAGKRERLRQN
jgi:hypothetical protein